MRQGERRPRHAILLGLALFALLQLLAAPVILRHGLALRDSCYGRKVARLKQRLSVAPGQPRPLLAVGIGSSRTLFGLRGQDVEPGLAQELDRPVVLFNMGLTGAGPVTNLLNLRRLLNEGVRPDLLLIEVMPCFLNDRSTSEELLPERFPASRLRHDEMLLLARHAGPARQGVEREWWRAQAGGLYTHRLSLLDWLAPCLLPTPARVEINCFKDVDASGWVKMSALSPEQARQCLVAAKADYEPRLRNFHLSTGMLAVVRETIDLAHKEDVAVALVIMPEGPAFRSWYPPATWRQIHEALTRLSHECAAPLLDLRESVDEDGFFDSHHLYPQGATRCTRELAEQIVPLLRSLASPAGDRRMADCGSSHPQPLSP